MTQIASENQIQKATNEEMGRIEWTKGEMETWQNWQQKRKKNQIIILGVVIILK